MNKELIAMCDTPEIQDRWEPKNGNIYVFRHPDYWNSPRNVIPGDNTIRLKSMSIYIPRIEDVLERIGKREYRIEFYPIGIQIEYSEFRVGGHDLLKLLILFYMHLEHNKTWNGEAWV